MVKIINNKNLKVLEYLKKENSGYPLLVKPSEITVDPYFDLGVHPEIVERLWDKINSGLPSDCRMVIYGTPALAHPDSAVILALSIGTEYAFRKM